MFIASASQPVDASFTLIVIYDYVKESKGIADNDKSQVSRHTGE
jgi:hypothetical protein